MNENNGRDILIIGNGFDRLLDLETSYKDWIDYEMKDIKDKGYSYEDIVYSGLYKPPLFNFKLSKLGDNIEEVEFPKNKYNENISVKKTNSWILYIYIIMHHPIDEKDLNISNRSFEHFGAGRELSQLNQELIGKNIRTNKGNWVDIEKLIEYTVFENSTLIEHITDNDVKKCLDDFLDMKKKLSIYIKKIESEAKEKDINEKIHKKFGYIEYTFKSEIISFNYTTILTNYILNHGIVLPNFHSESIEISLHGKSSDKQLIVFGANNKTSTYNIKQEPKDFFKDNYFEYTKMYQLQVLNANRKFSFDTNNIENVYVLGHSISPQDYNYFFSLIDSNPNTITFTLLYYTYNSDGETKDNKKDTIEAMYKMLEAYEIYSEQNISYKLNFEGRIKFQNIDGGN